jgi:hypothetical protein
MLCVFIAPPAVNGIYFFHVPQRLVEATVGTRGVLRWSSHFGHLQRQR